MATAAIEQLSVSSGHFEPTFNAGRLLPENARKLDGRQV